ncbi:hypothetical protein SO802_011094 [Lithocarpus litseifolius]|uniref:RNase H type-1 domain-containing protein n=1 Tax=Lithocarpus litseifolius TaxID=425828 RepID=A0AAW2DG28_9ROSI
MNYNTLYSKGTFVSLDFHFSAEMFDIRRYICKYSYYSVTAVEVIAASKALRLARDLGLSSIVLDGDSKTTIPFVQSPSLIDYGHLIDEAKELAKELTNIEFSHVLRQGNSALHNIARHPRHVSEYSVWMKDVPSHLFSVIQADSAHFQ